MNFKAIRREPLPPNEEKAGDIFSRLGYKTSEAISDLVDNSIDAKAKNVHIRFVRSNEGIHSVIIADDGSGMSKQSIQEAMRFGSDSKTTTQRLGKYGIGLKSASLSQAETVVVLSKQAGAVNGRRWTLENIKDGWICEVLEAADVRRAFDVEYGGVKYRGSGTIVVWERLEHLQALPDQLQEVLDRTIGELKTELGIRFHRFLETDRISISVDQQFGIGVPTGIPIYVEPLNPFSYEKSGHRDYPLTLNLEINKVRFDVLCHIWPPKSKSPGYRLGGGKVALRQGFYFYRNDRIIQAGGWNGLRADDGEPHLSLARVEIDLPAELDSSFKLDVTKSRLDPAPQFVSAIRRAETKGITFTHFIEQADGVYRKQKEKDGALFPLIPGKGISATAQTSIATILQEKGTTPPKKVAFKWVTLDLDEIVQVDVKRDIIYLNSRYKRHLREGSSGDAPVLKIALMFLLQEHLEKEFMTKKSISWLQRVNQALIASMKE
jgi:hypothetical protein